MSASPADLDRALPPLWWPLLAAAALLTLLALLALPLYGQGVATLSRSVFLGTLLLWALPLTLLQRRLWRRGWSLAATGALLLPLSLWMVLFAKAIHLGLLWQAGSPTELAWLWRGLEAPWLGLLGFVALHGLFNHAWALQATRQRLQVLEAHTRDAQWRALQLQLQPHFLFNTLNAISAEVGDGHAAAAQSMLARLGDLLRAALELDARPTHALAEELALAEAYLDIERARLGERLRLEWQIAPGLLDVEVPTWLLQPLLENAVRHGLAGRRTPGRLQVRVWAQDATVQFEVRNDLAEVAVAPSASGGIGLTNLRARLAALYGADASLAAGGEDGRFCVRVVLPCRRP
ncbi:MAG: histidine kinase [Xanthomonadales bacterium]|jgi:two-component system sensor histidine kinase AlgZ|nr:histidine kinase [Xanthomonadales bacterium]